MSKNLIGPLMADVAGLQLTAADREVLSHPLIGGVILFARNYSDPEQLRTLCRELRALKKPRLLIAVDHEGGRVQRFRVGFSRIPAMRTLGKRYVEDPARALQQANEHGATIARELSPFGIDLCFAPVLDRDSGVSQIIGDRAFSDDLSAIVDLSRAFWNGLAAQGMAATGKHFPGHGAVVADSHLELPVDRRSFADLEATELAPFKTLIEDGIPSLMMAHIRYTGFDDAPASLSKKWIGSYLRRSLGYKGVVFCDDLSMGGAAAIGPMQDRARAALEAGCDMMPLCNDRPALTALLDALKDVKPSAANSRRLRTLYLNSRTAAVTGS